MKLDLKLKLTMRAISMFEKASQKSFFDISDEDMPLLMYFCIRAANEFNHSFEAFVKMLENDKFRSTLTVEFKKIFELMMPFDGSVFNNINNNKQPKDTEQLKNPFVGDYAVFLIVNVGLDPNYVWDKMELWELQDYFKIYEQRERQRLEEQRLFTYIQVMPWLDSKKKITPEKMLPFPWEKEFEKKKFNEDYKRHEDIIRSVLGLNKSDAKPPLKEKEE